MAELTLLGVNGSVQTGDSGNTSLLLRERGRCLLVDCSGSPVQAIIRAGGDPMALDAVILTHAHTDHVYALPSLIHNLWLMKREEPLDIVAEPSTLGKAEGLVAFFGLPRKKGMFPLRWREAGSSYLWQGLALRFFPTVHHVPSLGFCVEGRLVYTADTEPCPLPEGTRGALLIHEAGGTEEEKEKLSRGGHSSAAGAARAAARSGASRLVLVHLPPDPGKREAMEREALSVFPSSELGAAGSVYPF